MTEKAAEMKNSSGGISEREREITKKGERKTFWNVKIFF